jgi:hypothetical protein
MEDKLTYAMLQAISLYIAGTNTNKLITLNNLPFFDSDERYIANAVQNEFDMYGISDIQLSLNNIVSNIDQTNKDINIENIKLIISNIISNYEYLKNLSTDAREKKINIVLDTFKKILISYYLNNELKQRDNYNKTFASFSEKLKIIIDNIDLKYSIKTREHEVTNWFENSLDLQNAVERKCTGWDEFDTLFGDSEDKSSKGIVNTSLVTIMGPPNGGKTSTLINVAARAVKTGKSVLFFTFEENKNDLGVYILQSAFGKTRAEIKSNVDYYYQEWRNIMEKQNSRIWLHNGLISEESSGNINLKEAAKNRITFFSFVDIYNIIKYVNEKNIEQTGKPLDFLLFDYLSKMAQMIKEDNLYERVGNVAIGLKEIARYFKIPVIVAHQFNRSGMSSADVSMANTAESNMVNFESDAIIALKESNQDKNMLFYKAIKNRHGIKDKKLYAIPDFKRKVINFIQEDNLSDSTINEVDLAM